MGARRFESVWDALETSEEAAAVLRVRSQLMIALVDHIGSQEMTQAEMASTLGITQPRLNDLLRGRIQKFNLDALVNLASRAGLRVDVTIRRAA
jgi:predicted XRE-type DNA-binding protein